MDSFGDYLKQLREGKGLSMEEVASRTKINPRYLKALEEDDLGEIPSEVFARGFIRSYARCLSVEESEVLTRFEQLAANFYYQKVEQIKTEQQKEDQENKSVRRKQAVLKWGAGLTVLVIAIGVFIQNKIEHRDRRIPQETGTPIQEPESERPLNEVLTINPPKGQVEGPLLAPTANQNTKTLPAPLTDNPPRPALSVPPPTAAVQTPTPPERQTAPVTPPVSESTPPPAMPDPLALNIEAVERSWVLVKIDDVVTKEVLLNPGEKIHWTANKQFRLSLGNAGGVKVELNGKLLDPFGASGVVVKDIILPKE